MKLRKTLELSNTTFIILHLIGYEIGFERRIEFYSGMVDTGKICHQLHDYMMIVFCNYFINLKKALTFNI